MGMDSEDDESRSKIKIKKELLDVRGSMNIEARVMDLPLHYVRLRRDPLKCRFRKILPNQIPVSDVLPDDRRCASKGGRSKIQGMAIRRNTGHIRIRGTEMRW
jgi:hypothetical protein